MSIISIHFPLFQLNLLTKTSCSCFCNLELCFPVKVCPFHVFLIFFYCLQQFIQHDFPLQDTINLKPRKTRDAIVSQL